LIPPSPPVIKDFESSEEGILLSWINSSSEDVISHTVYRKDLSSNEEGWEQISVLTLEDNNSTYLDADVMPNKTYAYTLVAKDNTGWESSPSGQLVVKAPKKLFASVITRFNGTADRELRLIRLSWKADSTNKSEFLLYRGVDNQPLTLYKTLNAADNSFTDTSLVINKKYTYGLRLVNKNGSQSQLKEINVTY